MALAALVWWRAQRTLSEMFAFPSIWGVRQVLATVFATIGVLLVIAGLALPAHLRPVRRGWMGLAHAISRLTTPVFMGLVYFLVLAPIGMARRILGKNPLVAEPRGSSFFVARQRRESDLERQF